MALEPQASESVEGAADGVLVPNPLPPALPDPGPGPAAVGGGGAQTSPISWKCSSLNPYLKQNLNTSFMCTQIWADNLHVCVCVFIRGCAFWGGSKDDPKGNHHVLRVPLF